MRRIGLWMVVLALSSATVLADPATPEPSQCCSGVVHGHTLADGQQLYWRWVLTGATPSRAREVQFLPLPDGSANDGTGTPDNPVIYVGEWVITVEPDTALMLPRADWVGESYTAASLTPDDDPGIPPKVVILAQSVRLTRDGRLLVDSRHESLQRLYTDTTSLPAPLDFPTPAARAPGIYADSALWVKGLGIVTEPMSMGPHVLKPDLDDQTGVGYQNTWGIAVGPQRR